MPGHEAEEAGCAQRLRLHRHPHAAGRSVPSLLRGQQGAPVSPSFGSCWKLVGSVSPFPFLTPSCRPSPHPYPRVRASSFGGGLQELGVWLRSLETLAPPDAVWLRMLFSFRFLAPSVQLRSR